MFDVIFSVYMLQLLIPSTLLTLFWHCHRALLLTLCNARYITGFIATNTSYIYQWLGSVHYVFKVIDIVMSLDCSEKGFVFVLPAYFSESSSSSCKYYCNKLRGVVLLMEIYLKSYGVLPATWHKLTHTSGNKWTQPYRPVLDLPTTEGWKAELT